ncbi:hypothetical protein DKW60_18035 [Leucothrix pacifica]|uniref:DUF3997 domain-containing protein n=1 Tax=Leucothrix pacifica TaxID=1247513 RepID=A0A317C746_9GAMM|nr:hypothetical protein DKW60_18035 [Leucothrix pacifica]
MKSLAVVMIFLSGFMHGCDSDVLWTESPYAVVKIDNKISLYYDLGNGNYIGRVSGGVVSVGSNKRYVVAKKCSLNDCKYYYIERSKDDRYLNSKIAVHGPLTLSDYVETSIRLDFPSLNEL